MIKVLVIDDETPAIRRLEIKLSKYDDVEIIGYAHDGDSALEMLPRVQPDLIFIDVKMPGVGGLEIAAIAMQHGIHVIFVTAFSQFAVQAFEQQVLDYLMKPVSSYRLDLALDRFKKRQTQIRALERVNELNSTIAQIHAETAGMTTPVTKDAIWIKDRGRMQKVLPLNIEWIEASRDYVTLHMLDSHSFFVRDTMSHFENILDKNVFERVHRSAIVNFTQIEEISNTAGATCLHLRSGASVRVGRSYKPNTNLKLKTIFSSTP